MPGFNQKGPMGQGSMSGRKMGKCTNFGANVKQETSVAKATSSVAYKPATPTRQPRACPWYRQK